MRILDQNQFNALVGSARIKPRLARELRFVTSTSQLDDGDWHDIELIGITDRSGNKGVLLMAPQDAMYAVPYELSTGIVSKTGQAQPIICDFCRTWQSGTRAGSISFQRDMHSHDRISFLCCADLQCSQHVRSRTSASRMSRAQLREDLTDNQRVERLKMRLLQLVADMRLEPIDTGS